MALKRLDTVGERIFIALLDAWDQTRFREIFGFGMVVIALVAAYKPAGSILLAESLLGIHPLLHAVWYAVAGWLLSRFGNRGRWWRFFFTFPMLLYIALTMVWINQNWERANLIVLVQYILLYIAMLKLIVDDDGRD